MFGDIHRVVLGLCGEQDQFEVVLQLIQHVLDEWAERDRKLLTGSDDVFSAYLYLFGVQDAHVDTRVVFPRLVLLVGGLHEDVVQVEDYR